ncbi:MAG: hypothetical protein ABI440_07915 [Casimicrobiaceae bacterium]
MRNARNSHPATATPVLALAAAVALFPLFPATAAADTASGTINYQSKAGAVVVNVGNVYLIKGPNAFGDKTIRRLIFTSADLGAKLKACASMMCATGNVQEGMTIDFDGGGPRLDYWVVGNHQKIQASGGAKPEETLKLTADTAQRLAGTLNIDDSASGGPKVNVKFDATLSNQYSK